MPSEDDIYRGKVPPAIPIIAESVASASSTSSFSGSLITGRLGALAAVLENAITRWARRRNSSASVSSSSSSSSSTSSHSIYTPSRLRHSRRRKRRTSSANMRSTHSEREVAARLRVRQEIRRVDRGFTLYLPPSLNLEITTRLSETSDRSQRSVSQTTSLPVTLNCLEAVLKKASKAKKIKGKQRQFSLSIPPVSAHHDYMSNGVLSRPASFDDLSSALLSSVQTKHKKFSSGNCTLTPGGSPELDRAPKAWWLDVASPTWDDLQTIGKLLHIHPLTLEDILQQDPREKMELFSKLGYYFVSFRTIQNATVKQPDYQDIANDGDIYKADDGALIEANIYMVVFKEGICTFYFTDVSEHIEKVRNRVQLLQDCFNMSSDWIAHDILDSVVDSFFPFLKEIEQQVLAVEALIFSSNVSHTPATNTLVDLIHIPTNKPTSNQCDPNIEKLPDTSLKEMEETPPSWNRSLSFSRFTRPLFFRRLKCKLQKLWNNFATTHEANSQVTTANTLLRMARARRLVTSLTRLLATKSEVISQIRKRFLIGGRQTDTPQANDDLEIAIYMGDIQDHILTLQQSLHHYEHMLSDSHPAYLTQLSTHLAKTKQYTDKAILMLSVISIGIMCIQLPIGLFSQNLRIPKNSVHPPGPYNYFAMVVLLLCGVETVYLVTVRRWWNQAKRTRSKLS